MDYSILVSIAGYPYLAKLPYIIRLDTADLNPARSHMLQTLLRPVPAARHNFHKGFGTPCPSNTVLLQGRACLADMCGFTRIRVPLFGRPVSFRLLVVCSM